ncbi:hypothetical protein H257_01960 [Aphanomyces astaci]|uniref:Uncharacterized protein n=1 Tax=Aphanomyces astaci TaxID=112090 RepID=W4H6K6_APHAT|nr:hypothetical protein H257_01960 [Aphanomyces astaci]ETV86934.1 hypothetical protein H257_01960 [Aphanomyces astaci]|eukprot:XP_009823733.1 hypothetical protein H257_01960 [Aphanomyces astaci]
MSDDDGSSGGSDIDSVGLIPSDKEGVSDAESVVRTPNVDDDDSSDDEPLSVLKQDVKKRLRSQNRDEDEELALAESNSEDESRRDEFVRDYSREGDLEMLHMPRATFPFPSYIRQAANQLDPHRHPLAATPLNQYYRNAIRSHAQAHGFCRRCPNEGKRRLVQATKAPSISHYQQPQQQ